MTGEIADRAAVAAATLAFRLRDKLHRAHFRRAAQRAHVHAGAVGVQHVEIAAQFADHAGDQVHNERVAVHFG